MLCLSDTKYLAFREVVRQPAWQQAQLAKPLLERQAIGRQMRVESQKNQQKLLEYADVDDASALAWLQAANAKTIIHGHTHKPANHAYQSGFKRIVMTDWDLKAAPNRAELLQLSKNGLQRINLN
jgi:UDP-2,3-diacylglucosamine hydrolase